MASPNGWPSLDENALTADIIASLDGVKSGQERKIIVEALSANHTTFHHDIGEAFLTNPRAVRGAIGAYTDLAAGIIRIAVNIVTERLHPNPNPTRAEKLSVVFVGGSGRAEMAPYSDIDLLFLTPYKQTPWGETVIETLLYILWDLKLKVGYAVRSLDDCIVVAREDVTIRTNLLEMRHLAGDTALTNELEERLWSELFSKTGPEFVEAKLAERGARHVKQGASRYLVEPNVKEGKGGLRDLQTLYWIAKYLYRVRTAAELVNEGVFTQDEYQIFREAEDFLWMTRCLLHHKADRAIEKLSFDMQVELASALGYEDSDGRRGVEHFMQDYFRQAKEVGELTRIFLVDLEAKHVKKRVGLTEMLRNALRFQRETLSPGYLNQNGRLGISDPEAFLNDPTNILRMFDEGLQSGLLIHPEAMRLVTSNLDRIDDTLRTDPEANEVFLNLLLGYNNPERPLRRMNELGVLGAFMPEFGRIECMMQFNMYHHYTVDEHTIQCVSILSEIENGELEEDLPVATGILSRGVNRRVLYVAMILHDIGKGLPEDHSIAGARIAETVAPRLGLSEAECADVVWLVRQHLLMSDVAQKRDIADPRTVRDFALQVATTERLDLLTVLTVCDIRGVGPGTWNNWKAVLLRELWRMTTDRLNIRSGGADLSRDRLADEARERFALAADHISKEDMATELQRHYLPFWLGLDVSTQITLSRLSRNLASEQVQSSIQPDENRDATRACFAMADHPGIFARLTGALALAGANVKDARSFTTSDGVANTVFWIQDKEGQPFEKSRLGRLRKMIDRLLKGEVKATEAFKEKDVVRRREREFRHPTEITFDNEGSELFTIIEVDTRDRPGLLHDLTRTMHHANLTISSGIIATYGNQAVDTFYVTDLFRQKIYETDRQKSVEAQLRAAIERGAMANED